MLTLTLDRYSDLIEAWNRTSNRRNRIVQATICSRAGHTYASSPLTDKDGARVLICTRCCQYVSEGRRVA